MYYLPGAAGAVRAVFRGADPADAAVQPGAGAAATQGQGRVQVNRENCHFSLLFLEKIF